MSGVFHKSVYTTRSAGYKYRTSSVNTDEGCFIEVFEEQSEDDKYRTFSINTDEDKWLESCKKISYIDKKFQEIGELIMSRIDQETEKQQTTRDRLAEKLSKIDAIVDSLLDFQNNVITMRQGLTTAKATLTQLSDRVNKADEMLIIKSSAISRRRSNESDHDSIITTFFSRPNICPENNDCSSVTTRI